MTGLATGVLAAALVAVPLLVLPARAIAVAGVIGWLLASGAVALRWPWLAMVAACVFIADYAGALWMASAPVNVVVAAVFGLLLLSLLQSVELATRVHGATVASRVARQEVATSFAVAIGTLGAAAVVAAAAGRVAPVVPAAVSPLVTAAAAVASIIVLALAIARAAAAEESAPPESFTR